jgi:hypothetical protein
MQIIKILIFAGFAGVIVFNTGCKSDQSQSRAATETEELQPVPVPKFDRDSAVTFVGKQVEFGPRVSNTSAHRQCKDWLVSQFKNYGLTVLEQDFKATAYTGETLNGTNIMAQYKPEAPRRILLAAHWDSRHIADSPLSTERRDEPIPGADDGGSGVGILLEIARQLQANPADVGVDLLLFDAEDHGDDNDQTPNPESWCLGSQYWSKNMVPSGYHPKYGILLDMAGAKNARFPKEGVSMNFAPALTNKVWKLAQNLGYSTYFTETKSSPVSP